MLYDARWKRLSMRKESLALFKTAKVSHVRSLYMNALGCSLRTLLWLQKL